MHQRKRHHPEPGPQAGRRFENSETLRALLVRLHDAGPGAWAHDAEAAALMAHVAARYAPLAHKYGLDPWEAASAAFEVMRAGATRRADDPWRMVTRAVEITCIAEARAQGMLCSTHQARRPKYSVFHDAERFSDRENPLTDYHPAFHTPSFTDTLTDDLDTDSGVEDTGGQADASAARLRNALEGTITLFTVLGWDEATVRAAIDYVTAHLAQAPSRASAYETLRRSRHARVFLDLPTASWAGLLRVILGNPDPRVARTHAARGVLVRLLIGEPVARLLADDELVLAISLAAPGRNAGRKGAP